MESDSQFRIAKKKRKLYLNNLLGTICQDISEVVRSLDSFYLNEAQLGTTPFRNLLEIVFSVLQIINIITNVLSFIRYQQFKAQKEKVVDEREDEYEGNIQISYNKTSLKKKLVLRKTNLLF